MRLNSSLLHRAAIFSLAVGLLAAVWPANVRAQEMHEFFSNTRQSPAAVDYGAAYYDQWGKTTATVTGSELSSPTATGRSYSITSWLGRRPSGIAYLGVQLDRRYAAEALISRIEPNSPAAQSGLRAGDVIRSLNGRQIDSLENLQRQIANLQPGDRVQLAIDRSLSAATR